MSIELYNGIINPDGSRIPFEINVEGVKVADIKSINHPAFNARSGSKGLFATQIFKVGDYIGSYAGEIKYIKNNGTSDWNPYQLTPDPDGDYYIDGQTIGNELRYCNDPSGTGVNPNAQFYQSDVCVGDFYVCDVYAIQDINPDDEILVSYGNGYWESLQEWYEQTHPYECPHCDRRYSTPAQRSTHIGHLHNDAMNIEDLTCEYCNCIFANKNTLDRHINNLHTKTTLYKCNYSDCDYESYNNSSMSRHKRLKHLFIHYKCFMCEKTYISREGYRIHMDSVHSETKFRCECGKEYTSRIYLTKHKRAMHSEIDPYKCNTCNKVFPSKFKLDLHTNAVHNKIKSHKCPYCDYTCAVKSNISGHIRNKHSDERPYKCKHCNGTFKTSSDINKHVASVHDKITHKCVHCEKNFSQKGGLYKHLRRVHKIEPLNGKRERDEPIDLIIEIPLIRQKIDDE